MTSADNGILAKVSGDVISGGSSQLPSAASAITSRMSVALRGGHLGMVRITYERKYLGKHNSKYWAWCAVHAEAVRE